MSEQHPNKLVSDLLQARNTVRFRSPVQKPFHVAIVGATGLVGREVLAILSERQFPVQSLRALSSKNSAGERLEFQGDEIVVEELSPQGFKNVDIAFFSVSDEIAKKYCPIAAKQGVVCIDKSSAFRMDDEIPLVVPEVNQKEIARYQKRRIIASPNCTAAPLVQVLSPLDRVAKLKRVVVCSYQAVSGAGREGIEELDSQVRSLMNFKEIESKVFCHRIAFNVLGAIPTSSNDPDGMSEEEKKVIGECRKILQRDDLAFGATCARVPVFNGHSAALHMEFEKPISPDETRDVLAKSPGIIVIDDLTKGLFPTPVDATGEDLTLVGRVRKDTSAAHAIALWLSSDNLRTGAALNAVRIAEHLCAEYLS